MQEFVIVALMVIVALGIIYSVLQSGYVSINPPELSNARISFVKYFGNCMPPVTKIPCCDRTVMDGFELTIDGQRYRTDSLGNAYAKLTNGTHVISYAGCWGSENLTVNVNGSKIGYARTTVQGNGASNTKNVSSGGLIEVSMNCCTQ